MTSILDLYNFSLFAVGNLLSSLAAVGIIFLIAKRCTGTGRTILILFEVSAAVWCFANAFEAAATSVRLKVLWSQISYIGTLSSPLLYFLFALSFSQYHRHLTRRNIVLLSVIPVATFLIVLTNNWHHLHWSNVEIDAATNLGIYSYGPWFLVFVSYCYSLLLIGFIIILFSHLGFSHYYRGQSFTILLASALPILANIIYVGKMVPRYGSDFTPVSFTISGLLLTVSIIRYRLFDLTPIAYSKLLNTLSYGMLVIDQRGRVIDSNLEMEKILELKQNALIGRPVEILLAQCEGLAEILRKGVEQSVELKMHNRGQLHHYDLRFSPLLDYRRQIIGQLITMQDITIRKQAEIEKEQLITQLQNALAQVKVLSGLLPICANCKKIRDDKGYWHAVETYIQDHSDADFTHSICPDCIPIFSQGLKR